MRNQLIVSCVAALATVAGLDVASARAQTLYGIQNFGIATSGSPTVNIFEIDPATGAASNPVQVTLAGQTLIGATALTANPLDGTLWGVVRSNSSRFLVTINASTGVATQVAGGIGNFSTLSFNSAGTLYGMTGQGGSPASTLFTLNTTTGAASLVFGPITSGADGEVMAFGPGDVLYHSSGNGTANFSTINIGGSSWSVLGTQGGEVFAMGYHGALSTMFGVDINSTFYSVDLATGNRTAIGSTVLSAFGGGSVRGLAYVPTPGAAALLGLGGVAFGRRRRA